MSKPPDDSDFLETPNSIKSTQTQSWAKIKIRQLQALNQLHSSENQLDEVFVQPIADYKQTLEFLNLSNSPLAMTSH